MQPDASLSEVPATENAKSVENKCGEPTHFMIINYQNYKKNKTGGEPLGGIGLVKLGTLVLGRQSKSSELGPPSQIIKINFDQPRVFLAVADSVKLINEGDSPSDLTKGAAH